MSNMILEPAQKIILGDCQHGSGSKKASFRSPILLEAANVCNGGEQFGSKGQSQRIIVYSLVGYG